MELARLDSWECLSGHIVIVVKSCYFQCCCPVILTSEWYLQIEQSLEPAFFCGLSFLILCVCRKCNVFNLSILNGGNKSRRVCWILTAPAPGHSCLVVQVQVRSLQAEGSAQLCCCGLPAQVGRGCLWAGGSAHDQRNASWFCCVCAGDVVLHHVWRPLLLLSAVSGTPALLHEQEGTHLHLLLKVMFIFSSLRCKEVCAEKIPLTFAAMFEKGRTEA